MLIFPPDKQPQYPPEKKNRLVCHKKKHYTLFYFCFYLVYLQKQNE